MLLEPTPLPANNQIDIWHPAVRLRCIISLWHLKGNVWNLWLKPKVAKTFDVGNFTGDIKADHPLQYRNWHLRSCYGRKVHTPTQEFMSIKGSGKTIDLSPKWTITLHLGILQEMLLEANNINPLPLYRSWHLTLCCGLEVQNPIQSQKLAKNPSDTFDGNPNGPITLPFGNFTGAI